jgi:hypothetical protein
MVRTLPLLALVVAACETTTPTFQLKVGEPVDVTLRLGETGVFGNDPLRVTLVSVPEDSRCPQDVVCVWEGNGKAILTLALGTAFEQSYDVNTSGAPNTVSVGSYRLQLIQLSPYPVSTSPIPQNDYRVRLRVERVPPPPLN